MHKILANRRFLSLLVAGGLSLGCSDGEPLGQTARPLVVESTACKVRYEVSSQWGDGFVANVALTNKGAAKSDWVLEWVFPSGQRVTSDWNAELSQSGAAVSAQNVSWNGQLGAGQSKSFGFTASFTGKNELPSEFWLNGESCSGTTSSGGSGGPGGAGGSGGTSGSSDAGTGGGGSPAGSGGSGSHSACDATQFRAGTIYGAGEVVENAGRYFQCRPFPFSGWCGVGGYEPGTGLYWRDAWDEISSCGGGSGGSAGSGGNSGAGGGGGSGAAAGSGGSAGSGEGTGFAGLISESQFNAMFPRRNSFYSYWDLVSATATYPAFAGTGDDTAKKREVAAFLANMAHETGELVYIEEIAKGEYCAPTPACPCAPGKRYYGRGPIQLSWNYNYCAAGQALGLNLQADPDLVARDAKVAWQTGLWFWMTQTGAGSMTAHSGITGGSFAETIRTINGALECNGGNPGQVQARVSYYQQFCVLLGVSPGNSLYC